MIDDRVLVTVLPFGESHPDTKVYMFANERLAEQSFDATYSKLGRISYMPETDAGLTARFTVRLTPYADGQGTMIVGTIQRVVSYPVLDRPTHF